VTHTFTQATSEVSLQAVALVFLKLGTIAFGGPALHIAMMEDEFITRRQWLTREQFLDRLAAANLIPGPGVSPAGGNRLCRKSTGAHGQHVHQDPPFDLPEH